MTSEADDPRYEAAIFPVFLLQTPAQVAADRGVEPQTLCRGVGFSEGDLADPTFRMSYRQASLMIQRALKIVPGAGLGLAVGSRNVLGTTLVGPQFSPLRVEFAYPAPAHAELYRETFGAPLHFGCAHNRCVLESRWLVHGLPNHSPLALKQALALLDAESAQVQQKLDLAATVERAIEKALIQGPSIESIARDLNMSGRTLRRRLGEQGLSFEALLNNVRRTRVMSLLVNPDLPIERVAEATGYSDVRSFRRAFKRWMGVSPSEFRQ